MIFFHLHLHGLVIFSWSADHPKWKLDFSITKPCRYQFKSAVFNQDRLLYCTYLVPPSTALFLDGEHTFSDISLTTKYWISPFQSLVVVIWWKSKRGRLFWWKRAQNRGCWLKWGHWGRSWRLDFGIEIKLTTNCCSWLRSLEQKNFILKLRF